MREGRNRIFTLQTAVWFVEGFHRAFGETQNGRDEFPAGRLMVLLQAPNGAMTFLDLEPRSGIGDVTATLSWMRPRSTAGWTLGADLAAKAPTGSASSLNGSGGWDGGTAPFRSSGERALDARGRRIGRRAGRQEAAASARPSPRGASARVSNL
jgi:hypothetical protein